MSYVGAVALAPSVRRQLNMPECPPDLTVIYQEKSPDMLAFEQRVNDFRNLAAGWNGYSAPRPSEGAIITTQNLIEHLLDDNMKPKRVDPSVIGGVGVTHRSQNRKVFVEIFNNGRVYALFSDGVSDPLTKEVVPGYASFKALAQEMRDYLDGDTARRDDAEGSRN